MLKSFIISKVELLELEYPFNTRRYFDVVSMSFGCYGRQNKAVLHILVILEIHHSNDSSILLEYPNLQVVPYHLMDHVFLILHQFPANLVALEDQLVPIRKYEKHDTKSFPDQRSLKNVFFKYFILNVRKIKVFRKR